MASIEGRYERWQTHWAAEEAPEWVHAPECLALVACSEYAAEQLQRHPLFYETIAADYAWADYDFVRAWQALASADDEAALMRDLRQFKHRYQVALIAAWVNKRITQTVFLQALSALAQTLIDVAHDWHFAQLCARYGTPIADDGEPMSMVILGMGKLGGGELNFSSDIDLIFAYRQAGETLAQEGKRCVDYEVFFRKLAQKIIHALDQVTVDGFVYRVDMRLRPFGQSGPLALSFDAMEQYYVIHGRNWERYAMMKARAVAGDVAGGEALLERLQPFVYRRYLDYQALNAITEMKQGINRQIKEAGMQRHIKLGAGGIREAEFCVQAMQMVYGGQYPQLQETNFLTVLADLGALELWSSAQVAQLREAYLLLRTVENAIQFECEQQSHQLPETPEAWQRLALATGFVDVATLEAALGRSRDYIHQLFETIFSSEDVEIDDGLTALNWADPDEAAIDAWLQAQEVEALARAKIGARIQKFAQQMPWRRLPRQTVERLNKLLPQILMEATLKPQGQAGLAGLLDLVEAVSGRGVYIDMLAEQPSLLSHLFDIAASSAWLMRFICEHPLVLDDVLSERSALKEPAKLAQDLAARLQGIEDDEDWLHALRDFKHAQVFKVAWADIHGTIGLMQVSDYLSHIAELVLDNVYRRAYEKTTERYGEPCDANGELAQFAIIGYGKLGGLELSYGSDLDILFLYHEDGGEGQTNGRRAIANAQFFTRMIQRLSNYLSAPSTSGVLYEIDTRLRPGGRSGMVVSSLSAFKQYQRQDAWTWEHQALSRARFVCGNAALGAAFEQERLAILTQPSKDSLRAEVIAMREKMFDSHAEQDNSLFHLKQSRGGLIDIEFSVQYLLLRHADKEPVIARMSDNIRQLAALEATGIISSSMAMNLRDAYRRLRGADHRRYLNGQDSRVPAADWQAIRALVMDTWAHIFA